jgi:hypothetical protein
MLCKIADLIADIPEAEGLTPRLRDYQYDGDAPPDLTVREEDYRRDAWRSLPRSTYYYMESGTRFYIELLSHGGMMLHASAVAYGGRGYLFSGPCGVGKSTHTRLWQEMLGDEAIIFNDDKPALRFLDGKWYAYGTPWCGKNGINVNMKVPLAGICFLRQAEENRIRSLSPREALSELIPQTLYRLRNPQRRALMLAHVESVLTEIPIFRLENKPNVEAAELSYGTMLAHAEQRGL